MSASPTTRVDRYLRAGSVLDRGFVLMRSVFDGISLGALDVDDLEELDERYYDSRPEYTEDAHNRAGLAAWEQSLVDRHLPPGCRVLVLGAGGGREVLALREQGFDAFGVEPNPRLASSAIERLEAAGHAGAVAQLDRGLVPNLDDLEAVLIGWGALMLVPSSSARQQLLGRCRRALVPGGVLLASTGRRASLRAHRVVAVTGTIVRRARGRPPVELGDALLPNYVHLYASGELEREAQAAGLHVLEVVEADHPGGDYWGLAARAPAMRRQELHHSATFEER
jgi:SAM-dependent methyltransferase